MLCPTALMQCSVLPLTPGGGNCPEYSPPTPTVNTDIYDFNSTGWPFWTNQSRDTTNAYAMNYFGFVTDNDKFGGRSVVICVADK